ncbi:MAG: homogentisate 1,2-dioxygenase [Myxococcales bacterium]|jgi:homogentisate 1,2-dioxygenase|nr:homogentisate 1,2-dioxygenase [Myxococcales bacterium]
MLDRMTAGEIPAKPHTALRDAEGRLRYEECLTRDGFDGPFTILYHRDRPHTQAVTTAAHGWELPQAAEGRRPLARRHYRSQDLPGVGAAPIDARVPLLFNDDVVLGTLHPAVDDPVYFSNGDGDDLFFIFEGGGTLRTALGDVPFAARDYVFVPKGLPHRFILEKAPQYWLSVECAAGFGLPKQWRNDVGQLRMDAPYSHRDFRRPAFRGPVDEPMRDLVVKRQGAFHGFRYQHAPLDVVGWDGTVYPWAFPILNFQPRVGMIHLPPTWHGTFAARGALICSFVPRPLDFHPQAIPCPYPHSSVSCDEFIFYCSGNFTSRRGVGPGSISHHPAGVIHGPHPGAYEQSIGAKETNELAVMLDTYQPLRATAAALAVEDPGYHDSFR